MDSLKGKAALVTGGSRGIGRAICVALAKEGANVVTCYAGNADAANETVALCKEQGVEAMALQADVKNEADVEKLFAYMTEHFGGVDILVNNAGVTRDNLMMKMSSEEFDTVIETNLKGTFYTMKLASKLMLKKRAGRIINISSVVGVHGNAGQANYAASKAGVIGMTKSAAKELGKRGITVNAVAPGFIETDMTSGLSDAVKAECMKSIPMNQFGTAENVANAVCFLASDRAAYITGNVIMVDGGMGM